MRSDEARQLYYEEMTMDTTTIKSRIKAGEAQPKHDQSGMTKLLVAIPVDLRTGLAELSAETDVSQQEIIRQAIRRLWEDGPSAILANARTSTVKTAKAEETTVKAKAAKTVHEVTPTVSIAKTGSELLHADLPVAKPTKTETESRPPQPSPDHAWVVRGTGGYWRAKKGTQK
jgi:hypothetical protein